MRGPVKFRELNSGFAARFGDLQVVSGGALNTSVPAKKDVSFYDYDGTLLRPYTLEEAIDPADSGRAYTESDLAIPDPER